MMQDRRRIISPTKFDTLGGGSTSGTTNKHFKVPSSTYKSNIAMVIMSKGMSKKKQNVSFATNTNNSSSDDDSSDDDSDDEEELSTIPVRNGGSATKRSTERHVDSRCAALPIPTFQLPLDENRYELWTIRVPSSVNIKDMKNVTIPCSSDNASSTTTATTNSTFQSNDGTTYTFQWGQPVENESFQLLVPEAADSDDEDDNENKLVPAPKSFQKHLNVVMVPSTTPCSELGQKTENTTKDVVQRRAYTHVPQKKGLKRRWVPLGGNSSTHSATIENPEIHTNLPTYQVTESPSSMAIMNGHKQSTQETIASSPNITTKIKLEDDDHHAKHISRDIQRQSVTNEIHETQLHQQQHDQEVAVFTDSKKVKKEEKKRIKKEQKRLKKEHKHRKHKKER